MIKARHYDDVPTANLDSSMIQLNSDMIEEYKFKK